MVQHIMKPVQRRHTSRGRGIHLVVVLLLSQLGGGVLGRVALRCGPRRRGGGGGGGGGRWSWTVLSHEVVDERLWRCIPPPATRRRGRIAVHLLIQLIFVSQLLGPLPAPVINGAVEHLEWRERRSATCYAKHMKRIKLNQIIKTSCTTRWPSACPTAASTVPDRSRRRPGQPPAAQGGAALVRRCRHPLRSSTWTAT